MTQINGPGLSITLTYFYLNFINAYDNYRVKVLCHTLNIFGLSMERPILDHHPKAHIHEIQRISWNPADFTMKSSRFHEICEIWWISGEIQQISGEIHPKPYKIRCFSKNSSVWGVHGGGYYPRLHEIQGHSPSPAFIRLNSFCSNIWIYKVLGGFHADFMKSSGFHVKWKDLLQGIVTLCLMNFDT